MINQNKTIIVNPNPNINPSNQYPIYIENGIVAKIASLIKSNSRIAIITDSTVDQIYGLKMIKSLNDQNQPPILITFPAGEANKTLDSFIQLHNDLNLRLDRKSVIINLGGGVTGDLGGFIACTYMRGITFYQVPTSLLAMVDASVGGKLGVNILSGKNCVGLFQNPAGVIIDPQFLRTLPSEEWANGFAEVYKHALLQPIRLFPILVENQILLQKIIANPKITSNEDLMIQIISESIRIKTAIVGEDFKEMGIRKHLNLGHTIGHALEEFFEYGKLKHGQGVIYGILVNLFISVKRGILHQKFLQEQLTLISHLGLKTKLHLQNLSVDSHTIIRLIQHDKKTENQISTFILLHGLGNPKITTDITNEEIMEGLAYIE